MALYSMNVKSEVEAIGEIGPELVNRKSVAFLLGKRHILRHFAEAA